MAKHFADCLKKQLPPADLGGMGERTVGEVGDIKVRAEVEAEAGFTVIDLVEKELEAARLLERDCALCITLEWVLATMAE